MKKIKTKICVISLGVITLLAGCSLQPTVYPNDYYQKVGKEQLQKDINECENLAELQETSGAQTAWEIVIGSAAVLSIVAAANRSYSGQSNAGSLADTSAILNSGPSSEENEQRFIETCLKKKGYDVTGWEY